MMLEELGLLDRVYRKSADSGSGSVFVLKDGDITEIIKK